VTRPRVLLATFGAAAIALGVAYVVSGRRRPVPTEVEAPAPLPVESCETCGRLLVADEVWELRSDSTSEAEREEMRELGITSGGTYMSATYCERHFPADRERWVA
jgi:hypothetical protein